MSKVRDKEFEKIKELCELQPDGSYLIRRRKNLFIEVNNSYKIKFKNNILNQVVLTTNYNNGYIPPLDKIYNVEILKKENNLLVITGVSEDNTIPLFNYTIHQDTIEVISKV